MSLKLPHLELLGVSSAH